MHLPHADGWIVVERPVREITSPGRIIKSGLSEQAAKALCADHKATQERQLRDGTPRLECNYWAMPREEF